MEAFGEGALKKAFDSLKRKLEEKGYFDLSRKRPIPDYIKKIGVITSQSGAAIKDFQNNIGEYGFKIFLRDVRVEGDFASGLVAEAVTWFNKNHPDLDILVLIRGGGGLEELKAFNSEEVADAIILSRIPILTGIGHEKDETIADYAADKRFSTPTAVGAFIKRGREELIAKVEQYFQVLSRQFENIIEDRRYAMRRAEENLSSSFQGVLDRYRRSLSSFVERMHSALARIFSGFRELEHKFINLIHRYEISVHSAASELEIKVQKCFNLFERKFDDDKRRLEIAKVSLGTLNPEAVLQRGYSIAYTGDNKVLKNSEDIEKGEILSIKLYKGQIKTRVEEKNK